MTKYVNNAADTDNKNGIPNAIQMNEKQTQNINIQRVYHEIFI